MKPSLERLPDIQWPPIRDQMGRIIKSGRIFGHGQQLSGKHERFQPDLPLRWKFPPISPFPKEENTQIQHRYVKPF